LLAFALEVDKRASHANLKLCEADLGIAVHVETSQHGNQFLLRRNESCAAKETFQVALINIAIAPVVDCSERLLQREIV